MGDKGKLIVSTKAAAVGRKIYILVVGGFMVLLGLVMLMNRDMAAAFGSGATGEIIFYGLCIFLIAFGVGMLFSSCKGFQSYCDVYEKGVVGTTGVSANANAAPQQNFDLSYDDIVNVTESGKTIFIYTAYGIFEVLALENRVEATEEIRKRMTGKKEG